MGVKFLFKETAFKIELCIIIPCLIFSFFLPIGLMEHLLLISVLFLILIVEAINTSIEACVDLVTTKWNEQAKIAKDCASSAVFFSVLLAVVVWLTILINTFIISKL